MIDAGVHGMIMLGTVGENCSLEYAEKLDVFEGAVEHVAGRVPVLTGVAECSTAWPADSPTDAQKHRRRRPDGLAGDGLQVRPARDDRPLPHRGAATRPADHGLQQPGDLRRGHHARRCSPSWPTSRSWSRSRNRPRDVRRITDLKNVCGERYMLFCGVDDLVLESMLLGATGWVSGLVNAFPAENRLLWDLATAGRWDEARAVYRWYTPLLHLDTHVKLVQYIKLAEQECGLGSEMVRAPRLPLIGRGARAGARHHPQRDRERGPQARFKAIEPWIEGLTSTMLDRPMRRIQVIDSHTGGEPTRVVVDGRSRPRPRHHGRAAGPVSRPTRRLSLRRRQRAARLRRDGRAPCSASRSIPSCAAGVIFFNNVGYLGMCGHGTIGVAVDAGPPGPDRAGHAPTRNARRRRDDHARWRPTRRRSRTSPSYAWPKECG